MSVNSRQHTVERLIKAQADLQDDAGQQQSKIATLTKAIGDLERSAARTSSASTRASKARQIESKARDLGKAQEKLADIKRQQARNLVQLNQATRSLGRAEQGVQKKQDTEGDRRRSQEIKHARELTRAANEQARLYTEMANSPLVIDLARLPTKIKVLYLTADPIGPGSARLRLDEEHRLISERIRASDYREAIDFASWWAARPGDLLQALNEHKPHILHVSGHGTDQHELVLQDANARAKLVRKEDIAITLATVSDQVRLVVFNSCFSEGQAEAVTQHIDAAIGLNAAIGDEAARVFAGQFYSSIGFGHSVQVAFDQALAQLRLEGVGEDEKFELHGRSGVDPTEIVLVRPLGLASTA